MEKLSEIIHGPGNYSQERKPHQCPIHGEVDALFMNIPIMKNPVAICPECEKERRERDRKRLQEALAASEIIAAQAREKSGIPKKFQFQTFNQFRLRSEKDRALRSRLILFSKEFHEKPQWLILKGGPGRGKTFAACVIGNEALENGFKVRYVTLPGFISEIKGRYGDGSAFGYIRELWECDLLILDEAGSARLSEDDYRNVFALLDYRYGNLKSCVIISNAQDLSSLGAALNDRISEMGEIIEFGGESWRIV